MKNHSNRGLCSSTTKNESLSTMAPTGILDLIKAKNLKLSKPTENILVSLYDNKFPALA